MMTRATTIGLILTLVLPLVGCGEGPAPTTPGPSATLEEWSAPMVIARGPIVFSHHLARGKEGRLLFVWNVCGTFDGPCRVGAVKDEGRGWSAPETLALYNTGGSGDDLVEVAGAIDDAGTSVALWSQAALYFRSCPSPHNSFALARRAAMGSGFGDTESAVRPFPGVGQLRDVAAAEDGTMVALLDARRFDSQRTCFSDAVPEAWAATFERGSYWTAEALFVGGVNPVFPRSVRAAIAPTPDGAWAAALVAPRTSATDVADVDWFLEVRRYRTGAGWSPAERIAHHRGLGPIYYPPFVGIAADAMGRARVVWWAASVLWSATFDDRAGWRAPEPFAQTKDPIVNAALAGNRAGDLVVAWSAGVDPSALEDVFAVRSRIDGPWSAPVQINADASGRATAGVGNGLGSVVPPLDVAIDEQGRTMALWAENVGDLPLGGLWSNQGTASGWSGARRLPADGTQPHVGFDGGGRAVAVWARDEELVSSRRTFGPLKATTTGD